MSMVRDAGAQAAISRASMRRYACRRFAEILTLQPDP
jgi:hypothetical protein